MQKKQCFLFMAGGVFLVFLATRSHKFSLTNCSSDKELWRLIQQRNEFSRRLDRTVMKLNQLNCEKGSQISETGGWCNKAAQTKHLTDGSLVKALIKIFSNKTVASFGDGSGAYKKALNSFTLEYTAFDGSPFIENITNYQVNHMDLTIPQYGLKGWDWIISLEVAEHIPSAFEEIFLNNIVRHAKTGVVLSWAKPGQSGFYHVNGRTEEWVKEKMLSHCFVYNVEKTESLRSAASFVWLKKNTIVFERRGCPFDENEI